MLTIPFHNIRKGITFFYNGNEYRKQSTRTARMIHNSRVFYFGMNDSCKIHIEF